MGLACGRIPCAHPCSGKSSTPCIRAWDQRDDSRTFVESPEPQRVVPLHRTSTWSYEAPSGACTLHQAGFNAIRRGDAPGDVYKPSSLFSPPHWLRHSHWLDRIRSIVAQELFVMRIGPWVWSHEFEFFRGEMAAAGLKYCTDPFDSMPSFGSLRRLRVQNSGLVTFSRYPIVQTRSYNFETTSERTNTKACATAPASPCFCCSRMTWCSTGVAVDGATSSRLRDGECCRCAPNCAGAMCEHPPGLEKVGGQASPGRSHVGLCAHSSHAGGADVTRLKKSRSTSAAIARVGTLLWRLAIGM